MRVADYKNSNSGGTRQVVRILCRAFAPAGEEVVGLTRKTIPG